MTKPLVGEKRNRLALVERKGVDSNHHALWLAKCECGNMITVSTSNFRSGHTSSCGCFSREMHKRHGHTTHNGTTKEYRAWANMIQRCRGATRYTNNCYKARGIEVCEQWRQFGNFFADMGECPEGMTLERRDNDDGYNLNNCVWADWEIQQHNKRNVRYVTIDGRQMVAYKAAQYLGLSPCLISWRARKMGISHQEAADYYANRRSL